MPYKSEAQRRFLHARHPEVAKKFDEEENNPGYMNKSEGRKQAIRNRLMRRKGKPAGFAHPSTGPKPASIKSERQGLHVTPEFIAKKMAEKRT